jgi:phage tail sheath protein FI
VDELTALVTDIQEEAMVIADTPMGMDPDEVVTWADTVGGGRVYNNSVAYYYSHGLTSNLDGVEVLGAASGVALRTIAYSDNVSNAVWFAPAGANRGVVTGVSRMGHYSGIPGTATEFVEVALNQGQRDNLYKDDTKINGITFLPGRGIIVMGQKTSAPVTSALDRINVVRLLAYIRRSLRKSTFAFVFEPNDQLTRDNLKAMVDGFLGDLITKRGLYDFATVCDESNNTPDRIDRSELYIDIALKPVKAAEFIYIPIRVLATGADL